MWFAFKSAMLSLRKEDYRTNFANGKYKLPFLQFPHFGTCERFRSWLSLCTSVPVRVFWLDNHKPSLGGRVKIKNLSWNRERCHKTEASPLLLRPTTMRLGVSRGGYQHKNAAVACHERRRNVRRPSRLWRSHTFKRLDSIEAR